MVCSISFDKNGPSSSLFFAQLLTEPFWFRLKLFPLLLLKNINFKINYILLTCLNVLKYCFWSQTRTGSKTSKNLMKRRLDDGKQDRYLDRWVSYLILFRLHYITSCYKSLPCNVKFYMIDHRQYVFKPKRVKARGPWTQHCSKNILNIRKEIFLNSFSAKLLSWTSGSHLTENYKRVLFSTLTRLLHMSNVDTISDVYRRDANMDRASLQHLIVIAFHLYHKVSWTVPSKVVSK